MHRQDNSTKEVDALVSVKFGKASNIARQMEDDIWCCSLRGSLAQLTVPDSQIESREFCQTLFFRRIYSWLILRSDSLKSTKELRVEKSRFS
jgi:hypothetical protein